MKIEYKTDKNKIPRINSVANYLKKIMELKPKSEDEILLFRGESKDYGSGAFVPFLFRGKKWKENECNLYRDILLTNPKAFKKDLTKFEKMVRMQHYGLPTRLLDVSTNPLVSLYFACKSNPNSDGIVFINTVKKDKICAYNSEIVDFLLRKIDLQEKDNKTLFSKHEYNEFSKAISIYLSTTYFIEFIPYISKTEKEKSSYPKELQAGLDVLLNMIEKLFPEKIENLENSNEDLSDIKELFGSILSDYEVKIKGNEIFKFLNEGLSSRRFKEKLDAFENNIYIQPPKSNERLNAQSGFLIFCHENNKTDYNLMKITDKDKILEELDLLNINQSTLFPDLTNTCEYIKQKYEDKKPDDFGDFIHFTNKFLLNDETINKNFLSYFKTNIEHLKEDK